MPLQNYVDGELPLIHAAWLNEVDVLLVTVFQNATTADAALNALGLSAFGKSFVTAADAAAGRTALGASAVGSSVFAASSAAVARGALGSTTVGDAVFVASDAAAARSAIGMTATGSAVATAASAAAARSAIGISYPYDLLVACSDETTDIVAGNGIVTFVVRRSFTLTGVFASLNVASSSGNVTLDVLKNGVSVLSTIITIEEGDTDSAYASTQPVISNNTFVSGDVISVNLTADGTGAKGLKLELVGEA
jgi:hypothetical protein